MRALLAGIALVVAGGALAADQTIEATTPSGDKVLLHPNGRWEFVNEAKQVEAKKIADQYPENQPRPEGAQGGVFGFGRTISPGDKDYNRGSLSGKGR